MEKISLDFIDKLSNLDGVYHFILLNKIRDLKLIHHKNVVINELQENKLCIPDVHWNRLFFKKRQIRSRWWINTQAKASHPLCLSMELTVKLLVELTHFEHSTNPSVCRKLSFEFGILKSCICNSVHSNADVRIWLKPV